MAAFMFYTSMLFFFLSARDTYLKFENNRFVKYSIIPCFLTALLGVFIGVVWFNVLIFFCIWIPASAMMTRAVYKISKVDQYAGSSIFIILLLFLIYNVVYFLNELFFVFGGMSVQIQSVCDAFLAVIIFSIASRIFNYFKVSHEKHTKIYEYMPVYWRYIPIGSILFAVMVTGMFFSMYLENYSRKNIEEKSQAVVAGVSEIVAAKLSKADEISKSLSQTPFIREAMSYPLAANRGVVNSMFENFTGAFSVSMIFTINNSGQVVFYSDLMKDLDLINTNFKYRPYFISAENEKPGRVFAKSFFDSKQSYYSSKPVYHVKSGMAGVIVIKEDIDDIMAKIQQYKNIYIVDENGVVFLSDKEDVYFSYLWPLYNADSGKKNDGGSNILSKEIFDKETIILNGEPFYVARKQINEQGWSVIYFSPLDPVKQFKLLGIAGVCGVLIIIILLFWIMNQSSRILALALQHKAILSSTKNVAIVSTDIQGKIIVYGQGAEDITGYSSEEFSRSGFENVFFDRNGKGISFKEAVSYSSSTNTEFLCKRKDGTNITMLISILPQYSVGNKLIGYIFSGADITNTKEFEIELEQQIKFLQMLIDSMPIAVFYKDSEMHLIGCNKAFENIMEKTKDDMIGKISMDVYFDKKAAEESMKTDDIIKENLSSVSYERIVRFRHSHPRNILIYKSSYKKIDEKFGGVIGVMVDVTGERKMQSERVVLQNNLIQQNKLASLGELAGSIAHELNNPLSIILGYSQVIIKDASLNSEAKKGVENIYEAAKRSKSVIMNMLEFSRSDTANAQIVHINNIIESTMLIIEKDFNKSGISVEKDLTDSKRHVIANPMQIQQVFLNILLNAKDAMPDGGKMVVKTEIKDKYFIVDISDTGSGISKENLPKIFDPFFTTKGIGKGTGLGLSICYGIINAHKGEISAKSIVGKGALFTIKFPLEKK